MEVVRLHAVIKSASLIAATRLVTDVMRYARGRHQPYWWDW